MLGKVSLAGAALAVAALIGAGGTNFTDDSPDQKGKVEAPSIWDGPTIVGDWHLAVDIPAEPNEDEVGWNCFIQGNRECGTYLMREGRGFITEDQSSALPSDRCIYYSDYPQYVMCRDGRVYLKGPGPLV